MLCIAELAKYNEVIRTSRGCVTHSWDYTKYSRTFISKEKTMKIKKVYLGRRQIRPEKEDPDIVKDAYFYRELDGNLNDKTWNNRVWTASWITYSSIWWIQVADFTTNSEIYIQDSGVSSWNTCSFWCRFNQSQINTSWRTHIIWRWYSWNKGTYSENIFNRNWSLNWYYYPWPGERMEYGSTSTNTRYNVFFVWDTTNRIAKFYVNWTLIDTDTSVSSTWWCNRFYVAWALWWVGANPQRFIWKISKVIFFTKALTDQEIADYYNQTKTDYWIQ